MTSTYDDTKSKMNTGELYLDHGPGLEALEAERVAAKELVYDFNHTRPSNAGERDRILRELFGTVEGWVWIEPPFQTCYGSHVHIAGPFYANVGLSLIDDGDIHIGSRVMFGPNVTITTAGHPIEASQRADGTQYSAPVRIEDDVWIGGNVVIAPGVTVGAGSVIGAGSVVTRNIPSGVVAIGAPCRVLRGIGDEDQEFAFRWPGDAGTHERRPR